MASDGELSLEQRARTPGGDEINKKYWLLIRPEVNKCGDEMGLIWNDFNSTPFTNLDAANRCAERLWILYKKYGEVIFGVNVYVFSANMAKSSSAFGAAIHSFMEEMPMKLEETIERLRYISSKFADQEKEITRYFKMNKSTPPVRLDDEPSSEGQT